MKIHETTNADGTLLPIALHVAGGTLELQSGTEVLSLPEGALDAVMARYAKPLEPSSKLLEVGVLVLDEDRRLRHVRHLATFDVIALDYLVYESPDAEPRCALATTVAAALGHLARAAHAARADSGRLG